MAQEILLDSGTNEVEILEFFLGSQSFGVNVAKVVQLVAYEEAVFTAIPDGTPAALGVILWQKQTIPLIDLNLALRRPPEERPERPIVLVTRFNDLLNGFLISGVNQIHRVSWEEISPTSSILSRHSSNLTGSLHIDDRDLLLVDFEYLIAELFPETKMLHDLETSRLQNNLQRHEAKLVFAEDSAFIRENVSNLLTQVGYRDIQTFENGLAAYEYLCTLSKKAETENRSIKDLVDLVITDIEMPKMDGLTLCRRLKKELGLTEIPVAIFSSLIDDHMTHKCKEVGADVFTTKPKISELVGLIDGILKIAPNRI